MAAVLVLVVNCYKRRSEPNIPDLSDPCADELADSFPASSNLTKEFYLPSSSSQSTLPSPLSSPMTHPPLSPALTSPLSSGSHFNPSGLPVAIPQSSYHYRASASSSALLFASSPNATNNTTTATSTTLGWLSTSNSDLFPTNYCPLTSINVAESIGPGGVVDGYGIDHHHHTSSCIGLCHTAGAAGILTRHPPTCCEHSFSGGTSCCHC